MTQHLVPVRTWENTDMAFTDILLNTAVKDSSQNTGEQNYSELKGKTIGDKGGKATTIRFLFTIYCTGILIICFIQQMHTTVLSHYLGSHNDVRTRIF